MVISVFPISKFSVPIDIIKRMALLLLWLSKYVFFSPTLKVSRDYADLASNLARGRRIALDSLILAILYRSITHTSLAMMSKKKGVLSSPLSLLQSMMALYFPFVFHKVLRDPPTEDIKHRRN